MSRQPQWLINCIISIMESKERKIVSGDDNTISTDEPTSEIIDPR